jgi:acetylornithine deacetylase/succinyl-diaminopimelate desuccinylase-like protein
MRGKGLVLSVLNLLVIAVPAATTVAQTNPSVQAARQWRMQHERAIVEEFTAFLRVPNVARDRENILRNAELISKMMQQRGVAARLVSEPGANPVVFGEIRTPGAQRTIMFYAHYDGQPLDPKEWATPPFDPVLRERRLDEGGRIIPFPPVGRPFDPESRLYARSAADDKAPIMAMLAALDAIRAAGLKIQSNIKFAFEGEEEVGSTNLERVLAANKALFSGDVVLMCDGPLHQTRRQSVTFGARGVSVVDLTVYGPRTELHSGHYGNWAPNPAMMLARLLASMKDDAGRILIDHFYDGIEPLGPVEKLAIAESPEIDPDLMREFWLGATDGSPRKLAELINEPSLNVRGMASARIGAEASNVIPSSATATIDMRLVKGMDARQTVDRFVAHVRKQGFFVVESEPSAEVRQTHPKVAMVVQRSGQNAYRTPIDLPISQDVIRAVQSARGIAVKIPSSGGSLPDAFVRTLNMPSITIPIVNHDNNQHSFNENLRIQNLWDGIELMTALLTM